MDQVRACVRARARFAAAPVWAAGRPGSQRTRTRRLVSLPAHAHSGSWADKPARLRWILNTTLR